AAPPPTEPLEAAEIGWGGIEGESRGGVTRPSDSRVLDQHPRGTEIRNTRQLAAVSDEDLAEIAAGMGVDALSPAEVGASLGVKGLPDFTFLPPSSRLQGPSGVTLIVDMENRPCHLPANEMRQVRGDVAKGFKAAAVGRRGITLSVERPGRLCLGEPLRLHVPDQRAWRPD
ncbi:MAG: MOSC domain-containing protein, partial [Shimia sp.]